MTLDKQEPPFKNRLKVKFSLRQKTFKNEDVVAEKKQEKILKEGLVSKAKGNRNHFSKRKLILYTTQKIEYIDPSKNAIKRVFNLSKQVEVVCNDNNLFEIITPKKTFTFKTENGEALVWAQLINGIKQK